MKFSLNRIYFFTGTSLLIIALMEVTILPFVVNNFFPKLYISLPAHKTTVMWLYVTALLFYLSCRGYYKMQLSVISLLFVYYYFFQYFLGVF